MFDSIQNGINKAQKHANDGIETMCNAFTGELSVPFPLENVCSALGGLENIAQNTIKDLQLEDYASIFKSISL